MADTKIEWATKVWNPVRGCSLVSEGCRNCYAMRQAHRFSGPGRPYEGLTEIGPNGPRWNGKVRLVQELLDVPLRWRKPQRVFVNSMSDLFHPAVPVRFIAEVFNTMAAWRLDCQKRDCDHEEENCYKDSGHIYQILTKRAAWMLELLKPGGLLEQDMAEYWPGDSPLAMAYENRPAFPNVWLGVSVEDQKTADERIPLLLQTPAAVRFVSEEPSLGQILRAPFLKDGLIHQWIWGGESGSRARPPHPDWARAARDECVAANVEFFFKQWGEWGPHTEHLGGGLFVRPNGSLGTQGDYWDGKAAAMDRVGKKASGRLLDGREWNEYPTPQSIS